jgi:hypothetical protein
VTPSASPPTAPGSPAPAAPANQAAGYALGRQQGKCLVCGRAMTEGEKYFAAVREGPAGLERVEIDVQCAESFDKTALLAHWRAVMPAGHGLAKPKVFVDDALLCDLFDRLADTPAGDEPGKVNFRFVLGLILMRKKLLSYESSHAAGGLEYWSVRLKGRDTPIDLVNPRLDEQQAAQVAEQLGQILSGDGA